METQNEMRSLLNLMSEYHGENISDSRLAMFEQDLRSFSVKELVSAWAKYRVTNTKFPMPKDLIDNIPDGRPSAQEAWGLIPKDEDSSVIWSEEMRLAFGACASLIAEGQITNAFFVFKEKYEQLVKENRLKHQPPKWSPSFGHERTGREMAVKQALEAGRIQLDRAFDMCPELQLSEAMAKQLGMNSDQIKSLGIFNQAMQKALTGKEIK